MLAVIWAGGAAIGVMLLLAGSFRLWQLYRGAVRAGTALERTLDAVRHQLGLARPVRLLIASPPIVPLMWGWSWPVVLLPPCARDWSATRLRQVLAHELAHVERYDFPTQFLGQLARLVYWFHPLVWYAWRRQRTEQEQACDDRVLAIGHAAHEYAEQLLTVTAGLSETFVASSVALAMGRADRIERRLVAILDASRVRGGVSRARLIGIVIAATLLTVSLATFAPNQSQTAEAGVAPASTAQAESSGENRGLLTAMLATDAGRSGDPAGNEKPGRGEATKPGAAAAPLPSSLPAIEEILAKTYSTTDQAKLTEAAIRGMLQAIDDPHADYFSAQKAAEMKQLMEGPLTGVGAELKKDQDRIVVVNVYPGSPAEKAGLRADDELRQIDRQPAPRELPEVVRKLRGTAGSVVEVRVRRKDGTKAEFTITRGPIRIPAIRGLWQTGSGAWQHWVDPDQKLAYLQIVTFNAAAVSQAQELLKQLKQQGLKGLVLDVRDCPGGLLAAAVDIASLFQKEGKLLIVKGQQGDQVLMARGQSWLGDFPLVVLIDGTTASASEVVAGALQERGRAVLVGDRTFGKGSVQSLIPVDGGQALKVTTAQMILPSGRRLQHIPGEATWGVDPNDGFYVPMSAASQQAAKAARRQCETGEAPRPAKLSPEVIAKDLADPQLAAAVKTLSARLTAGEFTKVGQPVTALVARQQRVQKLQDQRQELRHRLQQVERELGGSVN